MRMKPKQTPSFFKVLITSDFTRKLLIPPAFVGKYEQRLRGEKKFTLRTTSKGGKTWEVKMEKKEGVKYEFSGSGWNKFAKDLGLEIGEFLVFCLVSKSTFDVSIYATTACERQIPVVKIEDDEDSGDDDDKIEFKNHDVQSKAPKGRASKSDQESQKSPLYFEIRLKKYQNYRLPLTMRFCKAAGLMDKGNVGLEYLPNNRYQCVVLGGRPSQYRMDMTAGWCEFRKSNRLVFGKTYSFEFSPSKNVIQVQEVKKTK